MKYFPAFCDACERAFLAAIEAPAESGAHPSCPRCRAAGRLIPGAYYAERSAAFEALEQELHRARLSPPQAQHLLGLLERDIRSGTLSSAAVLAHLSHFPGLLPIGRLLPEGPELARVVAMLLTLLTPLATVSGPGSGFRQAADPADPLRGLVKKPSGTG